MIFDRIKELVGLKKPFEAIEVYPNLFQGSSINNEVDVKRIEELKIHTVIDLNTGYDPKMDVDGAYLLWPFFDLPILPDLEMLFDVASFGALILKSRKRLLVHCSMGNNRSGLVCGRIMSLMGMKGPDIVKAIQEKNTSGLWNPVFRQYIEGLV